MKDLTFTLPLLLVLPDLLSGLYNSAGVSDWR